MVLEEERFNREKHTQRFPWHCLHTAFDETGLSIRDIDVITTPWDTPRLRRTFAQAVTARLPASLNLLWPAAHSLQDSGIVLLHPRLKLQLKWYFRGARIPKIVQVPHHDAHAAIFFVSPFEEATVLVMDGYGDECATSAYTGRGNKLERQWNLGFFDSLGMLYTCATTYLGFKPFEEGTVMALAACGGPTYLEKFRSIVRLEDEGRFSINRDYISYDTHGLMRPFTGQFIRTFGPPRKSGEPLTDRHRDIAYALQVVTEETILHIVREVERRHPSRNLCISGGVALNCVANARILRDTSFERVWVPPCASDTGAPLGSTLFHYHQTLGGPRTTVLTHPFYGRAYGDSEITAALKRFGLAYKRMGEPELLARVARDLADSRIVGWFQGKFEMGPRALGNRSILSDARSNKMKDLINARIKHRESFRPFAPAVLIERAKEFFEVDQADPFMTLAPKVRADKVALIPAAVHVDGTGRIQTVERSDNPRYYAVIEEYAKLTGIPVILNTSFNRQEPIVTRPEEAISCYLRTDMDVLVLGDYYVTDRNPEAVRRAQEEFGKPRSRPATQQQVPAATAVGS
jgi:carbamoyltransferase